MTLSRRSGIPFHAAGETPGRPDRSTADDRSEVCVDLEPVARLPLTMAVGGGPPTIAMNDIAMDARALPLVPDSVGQKSL